MLLGNHKRAALHDYIIYITKPLSRNFLPIGNQKYYKKTSFSDIWIWNMEIYVRFILELLRKFAFLIPLSLQTVLTSWHYFHTPQMDLFPLSDLISRVRDHAELARWCHQMETFSALLAICAGNSPVAGEFPAQRPVTRSFDVYFNLPLNERLSKQSWEWWFETPSRPLWRHRNEVSQNYASLYTCWDCHLSRGSGACFNIRLDV